MAPLLRGPAPLLRNKVVPVIILIPTKIPTTVSDAGKNDTKKLLVTPWYNSNVYDIVGWGGPLGDKNVDPLCMKNDCTIPP